MSNIQLFQDVFAVNFPVEIADQVLGRIQALYGADFDKKYGHFESVELQRITCTVLNGLTPKELRRGLERMNTEKWCPTLPEFRSWCEQAGDWWTAEQAWAKAMQFEAACRDNGAVQVIKDRYIANVKTIQSSVTRTESEKSELLQKLEAKYKQDMLEAKKPITKLAKAALDEVRHILNVEGQKAAHFAFKDIYQDYLQRAKQAGRKQEMWEEPKAIGFNEDKVERERKGVPCPPELAAKMRGVKGFKRVGDVA